jgi:hypothetical protein
MRGLAALAAALMLSACATTSSALDFHGDYSRDNHVEMMDGSAASFHIHDGLRIGRNRDGQASLRIQLFFRNAHQCNLAGEAEVTETGLIYRERSEDNGEPFVLAIDIDGPKATLRKVEGNGHWLCGMRGSWGGVFERTGKRVEFVDG